MRKIEKRSTDRVVAMVVSQWKGTVGGPTTYTGALCRELGRIGWQVEILAPAPADGVFAYRNRPLVATWDVWRILRRIRPQVVHIHGRLHLVAAALMHKAVNWRCRVIFTFHTQPVVRSYLPGAPAPAPTYSGFAGFAGSLLLRGCDVVSTVSRSIVENLQAHTALRVPEPAIVIPSGAEPWLQPVSVRQAISGPLILSTVGVFAWDWKVAGHALCLEAVAALRRSNVEVLLKIAGDGRYRRYLEDRVEALGIHESVIFLGNVGDVRQVLADTDIYLHMALNEGCSVAIIEALAAGLPVIAAQCGGTPEVVRDRVNGLLVSPDPVELVESIRALAGDAQLRSDLSIAANESVRRSFSWSGVARQWAALYSG